MELHRHRWMTLCRGQWDEPYVRAGDGVLIVPINEMGEVLLVVEPTVTDGRPVLGLPAGAVSRSESPAESAKRELEEETKYRAGRIDLLHELHPLARHAEWRIFVYLARDLRPGNLVGDEPYRITTEHIHLGNFEQLIASGRLHDSGAIAALFMARSYLAN